MAEITVGIVRINNGCAFEDKKDEVGLHLVRIIDQGILGFAKVEKICSLPEDSNLLKRKLTKWIIEDKLNVILTLSKGTQDPSENITRTVTDSLLYTKLPGLMTATCKGFFENCFFAGIREKSIIINLPDILITASQSLKLMATDIVLLTSMLLEKHDSGLDRYITAKKSSVSNFIQMSGVEAEKKLMSLVITMRKTIIVSLPGALGLVLAEDVKYDSEVPPFDISSVSGYAVVSTDSSKERDIIGYCAARQPATNVHVRPGTCVRVQKYAGIPSGADAVIDDLFINVVNDTKITAEFATVSKNMNIMSKDSLRGILVKGTLLINAIIDHLTNNNVSSVEVYKMPDVAVFSTRLTQRQQWLIHTLKCNGFHGAWNAGILSDATQCLEELQEAFEVADVAVTIGVSPGCCLFQVLNCDFLSNVYSTGEGEDRVFFSNLLIRGQRKIWFGFPKNVSECSVERFLLTPLFYMAHRQYAQRC